MRIPITTTGVAMLLVASILCTAPKPSFGVVPRRPFDIYVSDTGNNCIQKIDRKTGEVTSFAGYCNPDLPGFANGRGGSARFNNPFGIDVDGQGNLYVADSGNNCIRKIDIETQEVTTFTGICGPAGMSQSTDGQVWEARFESLQYLSIQPRTGDVFVTEGGVCLRKVAPNGTVSTEKWGSCSENGNQETASSSDIIFRLLSGIKAAHGGRLIFSDDNCVRTLTRTDELSVLAGKCNRPGFQDGAPDKALFSAVVGVTLDSDKDIYVSDMGNNCIRKISREGVVSTLAGLCGSDKNGTVDGVGSEARFQGPWDLEATSKGNLIVADSDNSCIRRVSPEGKVTTIAGVCGLRNKGQSVFLYPRGVTVY